MTQESMDKGLEIQDEISQLKGALSQLTNVKLFDIDAGCSGFGRRRADPFLAEVQTEFKNKATNKIVAKIRQLEKEFKAL